MIKKATSSKASHHKLISYSIATGLAIVAVAGGLTVHAQNVEVQKDRTSFIKGYASAKNSIDKSQKQSNVYNNQIAKISQEKDRLLKTKFTGNSDAISNTLAKSKASASTLSKESLALVKPSKTVLLKTKKFIFTYSNDSRLTDKEVTQAKALVSSYKKADKQIAASKNQKVGLSDVSTLLANGQSTLTKVKASEAQQAKAVSEKQASAAQAKSATSAKSTVATPTVKATSNASQTATTQTSGYKLAIHSSFVVNGWPTELGYQAVEKAYYNGQLMMFAHTGFGVYCPGNAWHSLSVGDRITIDGVGYRVVDIRHDSAESNNPGGANSAWYFNGQPTMQTCDNASATLDEVIKLAQL